MTTSRSSVSTATSVEGEDVTVTEHDGVPAGPSRRTLRRRVVDQKTASRAAKVIATHVGDDTRPAVAGQGKIGDVVVLWGSSQFGDDRWTSSGLVAIMGKVGKLSPDAAVAVSFDDMTGRTLSLGDLASSLAHPARRQVTGPR